MNTNICTSLNNFFFNKQTKLFNSSKCFLPCLSGVVVLMEKCLPSFACLVMVSENQFSFYLLKSELMIHITLSQYQPVHNQTAIAEE